MDACLLKLAPQSPLEDLDRLFFPDGFPAKLLANGIPSRFKRSCGSIFWQLNIMLMTPLQRKAVMRYYVDSIRTQKTDWTALLKLDLDPDLCEKANLNSVVTSVLSAEPPHAALVLVEGCPSIADYCISQDFWELWYKRYVFQRLETALQQHPLRSKAQAQLPESDRPLMPVQPSQPVRAKVPVQVSEKSWADFQHMPPGF